MASERLWLFGFVILLTLQPIFSNSKQVFDRRNYFILLPQEQLIVLQKLFAAWNTSTPSIESNLFGWSTFDPYDPNFLNTSTTLTPDEAKQINTTNFHDPCYTGPWKGLLCYMGNREGSNDTFWDATVVGLTLKGASIAGPLPPEIWGFPHLTSLTLTDNPKLVGPIPPVIEIANASHSLLNILDLHSNGLNGSIPNDFGNRLNWLKELDLSNNQLNKGLPESLRSIWPLRTLKLSNNQFTSNVSLTSFFYSWSSLVTIDLSRNNFQEPLPDLAYIHVLHTLNMSHNKFNGEIIMNNFSSNAPEYLTIFDLSDNDFSGPMPNLGNWTTLKALNLSHNKFFFGEFPTWLGKLYQNLEVISLINTSLVGELDLSIFKNFTNLKTIELNDNFINGTVDITSLFYDLANLKKSGGKIGMLQSIDMRNNNITNVVFNSSQSLRSLSITINLQGNPYCLISSKRDHDTWLCFCYQICNDIPDSLEGGKNIKKIIIITSITSGFILIILFILMAFILKAKKEKQHLLLAVHKKFAEYDLKPTLFGFHELQKATRDFHEDMKLGEGGFGTVYKGYLGDGSSIAVKQLLTSTHNNMDEFLNEVVLLTSVKHRNLVKLKGCCFTGNRRLLVYEYVENYDLADILFDHKGNQVLSWPMRFNICMGIAHGLHYLHALVEPRIIHRDIKASNILLDKNMQPKIADFGLAFLYPNDATHITLIQVAGTKGYMAPEYARQGQLSDKVDVFSFGVLLLEIVSGRKNIQVNAPPDKAYLPEWAWELNEGGNLLELVDPTISLQFEEESEVQHVMKVALSCLQMSPERRPSMAQVIGMFQGDIEVGLIHNQFSDRMHHSHQAPSKLNTSGTVELQHADCESQALYTDPSSSTCSKVTQELELGAVGAR